MKSIKFALGAVSAVLALSFGSVAHAALIQSATTTLGGAAIDFEGRAEGQIISNQFSGITFGQVDGGTPQIDNSPFLYGYVAISGTGVLTGSTNGGAAYPTVAGLRLTLSSPGSALEFWLSDRSPLGTYTIQAFDSANVLLESFVVNVNSFVGFSGLANLSSLTVDSSNAGDAFAIDDVRFASNSVPEPLSLALVGLGLAGISLTRRRSK